MSRRAIILAMLLVACLIGAAAVVLRAVAQASRAEGGGTAVAFVVPDRPYMAFRSLDRSQPGRYGDLAVAPLDDLSRRSVSRVRCERLHVAGDRGVCIQLAGRLPLRYRATVLGVGLEPGPSARLNGFPSRARVSADGRRAALTTFVTGHSYRDLGAFSTQVRLIDLADASTIVDSLEDLPVVRDGRTVDAIDLNYWGVTFAADSDTFYATMSTDGRTYLVRGSVSARSMTVVRENAECPSLSPDGRTIVYKKRVGADGLWRFTALDLASMVETPLAETQSIDDQVEWIDAGTVAYRNGEALWAVPADGTGAPRRLLASADSPAVTRLSAG
jgi:WD40-like Beta Propeller Repeat